MKDLLTRKLPAELVVDIFSRVVPPKRREEWSESSPPHTTLTPLSLGKICRSWRSIVWNTPMLWTYVTLTLNREHYETQVELLPGWLERSGHHPLTIIMRGPGGDEEEDWEIHPPYEVMCQLAEVSERWKEVDMFIPYACYTDLARIRCRLPLLERLTIRPPDGVDFAFDYKLHFFHDAPRLQGLTINGLHYADATALPWHQLRCLYGQDLLVADDCYAMLKDAENLIVCRFNNVQQSSDFASASPEMIHLPRLQILELSTIGNILATAFLDSLSLPSLVELELGLGFTFDDWKYFSISDLTSFVRRSGCLLQRLTLFKIRLIERELIEGLVSLPHLVELHLHAEYPKASAGMSISDTFLFALSPPSSRPFGVCHPLPPDESLVPKLEILGYNGPLSNITPQNLQTMLEYRWYGISHASSSPCPCPSSSSSSSGGRYSVERLHKVSLESASSITITPEVQSSIRSLITDQGMDLTLTTNGFDASLIHTDNWLASPDQTVLGTSGGMDTETTSGWVPDKEHETVARQSNEIPLASAPPSPQVCPGPQGMFFAPLAFSEDW
ncbi:hypothetical protein EST38_g6563 [Candolleomyces aberdarensis]|uniref:Uncharacterized protein n=1 Tax=Candolleomyces aberdarensis TaxID=2316362 RepID=A0A4Q2DKN6_9AGAR|nr:hypothetical protein EST38_g6563 [Candolleomyces aberdarensis]